MWQVIYIIISILRKLLWTIIASITYITCLGVTWLLTAPHVIHHSTASDFLLLFFFNFLLLETLWSLVCGILLLFYLLLLPPWLNSCLLEDILWPPTRYIVLSPLDLYLVICLLFVTPTIHLSPTPQWRSPRWGSCLFCLYLQSLQRCLAQRKPSINRLTECMPRTVKLGFKSRPF